MTATVNGAQEDYDFYTRLLGMRLVKETVNFDNERVYHFYYANKTGSPSTVFTTFPYKGQGVRPGVAGYGQVYETAFSVPEGAFSFWRERLKKHGLDISEETRFGQKYLLFKDPSGLRLSILKDETDRREPVWATEKIAPEYAIRGIHHVTLAVDDVDEVIDFLEPFGYNRVHNDKSRILMKAIGNGHNNGHSNGHADSQPKPTMAGKSLVILRADGMPRGVNGLGTVHHVAHRVASLEDSLRIKTWLEEEHGIRVTDVRDRKYFQSIYFRIPGGILFEVATEGPGFLVDESVEELGGSLKLPDWQEKWRSRIEENLPSYKK